MHDPLKVDHLETHPDTTAYLTALPVREGVKGSMLGRPLPQRERLLKEAYDYKEVGWSPLFICATNAGGQLLKLGSAQLNLYFSCSFNGSLCHRSH